MIQVHLLIVGCFWQVIDQEIYTIMVIMALVTTFMTTPLVMLLYEPARDRLPHTTKVEHVAEGELRLLVCLQVRRLLLEALLASLIPQQALLLSVLSGSV